jgi:hypothetical protein
MPVPSDSPSQTQPFIASGFGSTKDANGKCFICNCSWLTSFAELETIGYGIPSVSDTHIAELSEVDASNLQENDGLSSSPTQARYVKQNKSAQGKLAYVVYAGNEVGVFYNW